MTPERRLVFGYAMLVALSILGLSIVRSIGERMFGPGVERIALAPLGSIGSSIPHVLLALVTVIIAARLVGALFQLGGQPAVVGEIVAGLLLGPSALGAIAPDISMRLIPPDAVGFLSQMSQVGVIFYMFLIGVQLDSSRLVGKGEAAVAISHASIIVPFVLGAGLAIPLYAAYDQSGVPFTAFALFLGVALSITAFPVLARILTERGLHNTPLGTLALTVAAVDDVTAWFLLALVVALVRAKMGSIAWTVSLTMAYIGFMFVVAAPLLRRLTQDREVGREAIAAALVGLLLSALASESIGIHAIFGAFVMGVIIPAESPLARELIEKLEDVTLIVFLPIFFAFTGLRTKVGLLQSADQWMACGLIIVTATVGKIGGTMIGGWLARVHWRDSLRLGVLMNTRGLMELVVLNVALDLGIISALLFTMMVVMAVVTTFMTTPLLGLVGGPKERSDESGVRP